MIRRLTRFRMSGRGGMSSRKHYPVDSARFSVAFYFILSLSLSFPALSLNLSTYEGHGFEIIMLRVPFSTPWHRHELASLSSLLLATGMSPKRAAISKVLVRQNFSELSSFLPFLMPEERWGGDHDMGTDNVGVTHIALFFLCS